MDFTLGEAARQCGIAKGTISKAIKTGKLSAIEARWRALAAYGGQVLVTSGC
jgi:hypothetical protein